MRSPGNGREINATNGCLSARDFSESMADLLSSTNVEDFKRAVNFSIPSRTFSLVSDSTAARGVVRPQKKNLSIQISKHRILMVRMKHSKYDANAPGLRVTLVERSKTWHSSCHPCVGVGSNPTGDSFLLKHLFILGRPMDACDTCVR
jgi:hypothetical protein